MVLKHLFMSATYLWEMSILQGFKDVYVSISERKKKRTGLRRRYI
jgi:hypothetical protein